MKNKNLDEELKTNSLSFTQQRRVILEELENIDDHLTADQIYFKVKKRMPKVSVGTIYRNLSVLVELKLVDKVETSYHTESHYEINHDDHYHIICTKCLRIDDLEHYRALSIEPTAEKISGYEITGHSIELIGICPKCKKQDTLTQEIEIPKNEEIIKKEEIVSNQINKSDEIKKPTFPNNNKKRRFFFGRRNGIKS